MMRYERPSSSWARGRLKSINKFIITSYIKTEINGRPFRKIEVSMNRILIKFSKMVKKKQAQEDKNGATLRIV